MVITPSRALPLLRFFIASGLESDLKSVPPRINLYHDLLSAIMWYDPSDEWQHRDDMNLLPTASSPSGQRLDFPPKPWSHM